jgi:tRNA nucleotidyltransferase/poly(A) polymerase
MNNQPIFITGSHRSGTTWVGKMIAASGHVRYVHEPFHISFSSRGKIDKWFQYIYPGWEHEQAAKTYLSQKISLNLPEILRRAKQIRSLSTAQLLLKELLLKFQQKRALIKDPIALFSADWIQDNYQPKTIVTLRHPAAFVGSLKVANWNFPFQDFLAQPRLLEDRLRDYRAQIEQFAANPPDIIQQGILLWNIFHSQILDYKHRHSTWYYVRHEDLSLNPEVEFTKLMNYLGMELNQSMREALDLSTSGEKNDKWNRDSKENIYAWKERLSPQEIEIIKQGTAPIANEFYTAQEW